MVLPHLAIRNRNRRDRLFDDITLLSFLKPTLGVPSMSQSSIKGYDCEMKHYQHTLAKIEQKDCGSTDKRTIRLHLNNKKFINNFR